MPESTSIISIRDLVKDYGDTRAVDHLELDIRKGEIFGLLGPNGAGKTTIILSLMGLTDPTSGTVRVKGYNASSEPLKVKAITGYLSDDVGFSDNSTGFESLVYTARLNGIPRAEATASAKELLRTVGLQKSAHQKTQTYSKGMIQRLGLADVLIKKPEIMVLDEPTIGIDPKGINEFLQMIRSLSKNKGITVLLCSHLLHQVQKICDRVGILVDGQLRAVGDIDQLANKLFGHKDTTITVEVTPLNDSLVEMLEKEELVGDIRRNGKTLMIKGTRKAMPQISRKIVHYGADLYRLSYREYGLDDIYQQYFEGGEIDA